MIEDVPRPCCDGVVLPPLVSCLRIAQTTQRKVVQFLDHSLSSRTGEGYQREQWSGNAGRLSLLVLKDCDRYVLRIFDFVVRRDAREFGHGLLGLFLLWMRGVWGAAQIGIGHASRRSKGPRWRQE